VVDLDLPRGLRARSERRRPRSRVVRRRRTVSMAVDLAAAHPVVLAHDRRDRHVQGRGSTPWQERVIRVPTAVDATRHVHRFRVRRVQLHLLRDP